MQKWQVHHSQYPHVILADPGRKPPIFFWDFVFGSAEASGFFRRKWPTQKLPWNRAWNREFKTWDFSYLDVLLEVSVNGCKLQRVRIHGLFHLLTNGIYWGYITHWSAHLWSQHFPTGHPRTVEGIRLAKNPLGQGESLRLTYPPWNQQ